LRLVAHQPKRLNNAVVNPVDIYFSSLQKHSSLTSALLLANGRAMPR
jgi:hypothetical protein